MIADTKSCMMVVPGYVVLEFCLSDSWMDEVSSGLVTLKVAGEVRAIVAISDYSRIIIR